jgi:hypothetical protein
LTSISFSGKKTRHVSRIFYFEAVWLYAAARWSNVAAIYSADSFGYTFFQRDFLTLALSIYAAKYAKSPRTASAPGCFSGARSGHGIERLAGILARFFADALLARASDK